MNAIKIANSVKDKTPVYNVRHPIFFNQECVNNVPSQRFTSPVSVCHVDRIVISVKLNQTVGSVQLDMNLFRDSVKRSHVLYKPIKWAMIVCRAYQGVESVKTHKHVNSV